MPKELHDVTGVYAAVLPDEPAGRPKPIVELRFVTAEETYAGDNYRVTSRITGEGVQIESRLRFEELACFASPKVIREVARVMVEMADRCEERLAEELAKKPDVEG